MIGAATRWPAPGYSVSGASTPELAARPDALALATAGVALVALAGEGGASAAGLVAWHGCLALLVVLALLRRPARCGLDPVALAGGALFGAVVLLGAAFVPYWYAAWLALLEWAAFAALIVLAARGGRALLAWLPLPLLAAAMVEVGWLAAQAASGARRPAGTLLNPNHLAAWLVVVLLVVWGGAGSWRVPASATTAPGRPPLAILPLAARAIAVLAAIAGLLITGSRGALVGLAAGAAVLGLCAWPRLGRRGRLAAVVAAAAIVLLGLVVGARRLGEWDPFRYHRLAIWSSSVAAFADAPWAGLGPGQFAVAAGRLQFPDGVAPLRFDREFSSPHSDWLHLPVAHGLAGASVLGLTALAVAVRLARRRRGGDWPAGGDGALAALVALAAHSAVADLSSRPAVWVLAALLLGALLSRPRPPWASRLHPVARVPLAAVVALVFAVGDVGPYLSWTALTSPAPQETEAVTLARLERSAALNPVHPGPWIGTAQTLAGGSGGWDLDGYARAREAAERAIRLQGAGVAPRLALARVEAAGCRRLFRDRASRERARVAYERAAQEAPRNPLALLELGHFLLGTGDAGGALEAAERALALEPQSVAPRLLLAEALLERGRPPDIAVARERLAETRELAARWKGQAAENPYSRQLLAADPAALARLDRRASRPAPAAGEAGADDGDDDR